MPAVKPPVKPLASAPELDEPALVLTHADLAELSKLLSAHVETRDELMKRVKLLSTLSVQGVEVTFERGLLERLKSRTYGAKFGPWLRDRVIEWGHAYVNW